MAAIQDKTRDQIAEVQTELKRSSASAGTKDAVRSKLTQVTADGCFGFHNPDKSKELLSGALAILKPPEITSEPQAASKSPPVDNAPAQALPALTLVVNTAPPMPAKLTVRPVPTPGAIYVTKRGDTLWKLAAAAYGDGRRHPQIKLANSALFVARPNDPPAGTRLAIPPR